MAKLTVAVLPHLKTSSLTKRPNVPMIKRINPVGLITSFMDSSAELHPLMLVYIMLGG